MPQRAAYMQALTRILASLFHCLRARPFPYLKIPYAAFSLIRADT